MKQMMTAFHGKYVPEPDSYVLPAARRILVSVFLATAVCMVSAQQVEPVVALGEVEVKAARVVRKADGMLLYPSDEQKQASASGYAVLQKLALPNIRIDDVSHTVSAIDNRGSVQIRINGIIVDKPEMIALDPKSIARVEFVDNPGVRYGEGIAYVIDITTCRTDSGYTLGADVSQSLTAKNGDYTLYAKWNTGKSEWTLNYGFGYRDFKGNRMEETAHYHLNDGSVYTIRRGDVDSRGRYSDHNVKLTYNWADSTDCVFQASLSGGFHRVPDDFSRKSIADGTKEYTAVQKDNSKTCTPVADLYYFRRITPRQTVTFNAVGTYIDTRSSDSYDEGNPYSYGVDGQTGSLLSEAIYENRLKPFTLSVGINYKYKYTRNEYTGDVDALNVMYNHRVYLFSELKGVVGRLRYSAGVGATYMNYRQGEHGYDEWLFCPKASLAYDFGGGWQLNYNFQSNERASRIAMIGDAVIRNNSMEWTVGSPDLRPNRDTYNILQLSYNNARLQSNLFGMYKMCHHPNMAAYERTPDDKFIYTQRNQKEIDMLQVMAYANYWLVPEKFSAALSGALFRCFNFGEDYTHCYTSYQVCGSMDAYLGHWTLSAYADNGWRLWEGETRIYNGAFTMLKCAYRCGQWQFALTWQQPLTQRYKMHESEVLSCDLQKLTALYSGDAANLVSLSVTWRLNKGRKYRSAAKTIHLKDDETGIIR